MAHEAVALPTDDPRDVNTAALLKIVDRLLEGARPGPRSAPYLSSSSMSAPVPVPFLPFETGFVDGASRREVYPQRPPLKPRAGVLRRRREIEEQQYLG